MNSLIWLDQKIMSFMDSVVLYFHNQFDLSRQMLLRITFVFWTLTTLMQTHSPLILGLMVLVLYTFVVEEIQSRQPVDSQNARIADRRDNNGIIMLHYFVCLSAPYFIAIIPTLVSVISNIGWALFMLLDDTFVPTEPPKRKKREPKLKPIMDIA